MARALVRLIITGVRAAMSVSNRTRRSRLHGDAASHPAHQAVLAHHRIADQDPALLVPTLISRALAKGPRASVTDRPS